MWHRHHDVLSFVSNCYPLSKSSRCWRDWRIGKQAASEGRLGDYFKHTHLILTDPARARKHSHTHTSCRAKVQKNMTIRLLTPSPHPLPTLTQTHIQTHKHTYKHTNTHVHTWARPLHAHARELAHSTLHKLSLACLLINFVTYNHSF